MAATCFTKDQAALTDKILACMQQTPQPLEKRESLASLKSIPYYILKKHTQAVNDVLCYIEVNTIQDSKLLYCGVKVVGELCGVSSQPHAVYQPSLWKIRLQKKPEKFEHDLSWLCELQQRRLLSQTKYQKLDHCYNLSCTPILVICEQLRQCIKVIRFHLQCYQAHKDKLQQNRLFKWNQRALLKKLLNPASNNTSCSPPPKADTIKF